MRFSLSAGATRGGSERRARSEVVPVVYGRLGGFRPHSSRFKAPDARRLSDEPLVSCLCVTENRRAFVPWLLWNFDRQLWRRRELVIVDSSDPPLEPVERNDVRILHAPLGTSLGKKRNLALDAARGEAIAWFDDDDWQHPKRLSLLVPLLREAARRLGASFVGPSRSFFIDLLAARCERYLMHHYAIFNGSVFYTDMVRHARFPEDVVRTEDTRWLASLLRDRQGAALVGEQPTLFMWLSHDVNITNRTSTRRLDLNGEVAVRSVGAAWGETPLRLAQLRKRLSEQPAAPPVRLAHAKSPHTQAAESHGAPEDAAVRTPSALPRREPATRARVALRSSPARLLVRRAGKPVGMVVYALAPEDFGPKEGDALAAIAVQRKAEWASADYVGFVPSDMAAAFDWDAWCAVLDCPSAASPVHSFGSIDRTTLRRLVEPWPNGEALAEHLFVRRLQLSPNVLGSVLSVPKGGFVAPAPALSDYVRRWLVPLRAVLDRSDPEIHALLGNGAPRKTDRVLVNHALCAAILAALAPLAFREQGRRVERTPTGYVKKR